MPFYCQLKVTRREQLVFDAGHDRPRIWTITGVARIVLSVTSELKPHLRNFTNALTLWNKAHPR